MEVKNSKGYSSYSLILILFRPNIFYMSPVIVLTKVTKQFETSNFDTFLKRFNVTVVNGKMKNRRNLWNG